jgi:hypothetical protein
MPGAREFLVAAGHTGRAFNPVVGKVIGAFTIPPREGPFVR